jgi:hypothetical protein
MNNQTETKRRGRPAGSTSFVRVNAFDLIDVVGKDAKIVVSKKWLEEIGLTIAESVATLSVAVEKEPDVPQEKIAYSLTSFN